MSMPGLAETGLGDPDRLNLLVYGGFDVYGQPLVVFVDRFEEMAFHAEPGLPEYEELF